MNRLKTNIIAIVVALIIIGVIWFAYVRRPSSDLSMINKLPNLGGSSSQQTVNDQTTGNQSGGFFSNLFNTSDKTYLDSIAGFSFKYPKEYTIKEISDADTSGGRTLLFSKGKEAASVQFVVSDFDEDIVLTVDRIEQDVPDLTMNDPQVINIGSITKGVKFGSDSGVSVWFVYKHHLFQAATLSAESDVLDKIASTFKI